MRESLAKLTVEDVNRAVRKHLSATNLSFVIITKDADDLKNKLLTEEAPAIKYEAAKPQELLDEDKTISAIRLNIAPEKVRITPVEEVFSR